MDVAPEFRTPEFEQYFSAVQPIAKRIARKRARPHALLSAEDLTARALEVCLLMWQKYHATKPLSELLPISAQAVQRRLTQARMKALKLGEAEVILVPLDAPLNRRTTVTVGETLRAPERRGGDDAPPLWPARRVVIHRPLSDDERELLRELLSPSTATVDALRSIWGSEEQQRRHWNWATARAYVLARGLGWDPPRVRRAYRGVCERTRVEFYAEPPAKCGYEETEVIDATEQEETTMVTQESGAPDSPEVEQVEKSAESKAPRAPKKGKSKGKKKQDAPATGPKLKVGAVVKYLGTGRAKNLRGGTKGVVKRVWPEYKYYGIAFGEEKKYHVLAARHVAEA